MLTVSLPYFQIYAMKSMIKDAMVVKNQVGHIRAERDVLADARDTSWIVQLGLLKICALCVLTVLSFYLSLDYTFQDHRNLYMVMEYLPGGDLMGLLMKLDTFSEDATRQYMCELALAIQYGIFFPPSSFFHSLILSPSSQPWLHSPRSEARQHPARLERTPEAHGPGSLQASGYR